MRKILAAAALLTAATVAAASAPAAGIDGRWVNPTHSVVVDVGPCGQSQCGSVEWASNQAREDAREGAPNLIGAKLLTALQEKQDGEWKGRLFVPDEDVTVTAELKLLDARQLKVSGCILGGLICKSQVWTRAV